MRDFVTRSIQNIIQSALALGLLAAGLAGSSCKPRPTAKPDQNSGPTKVETCLVAINNDTNSAIEQFLEADLTQGKLFSRENPLSYSEADFAKLDRSSRDKVFQKATSELTAAKKLARAVKERRDHARSSGDTALATKCNAQLSEFAERLQGPENLKLTQLVGAAIKKMAAE